MLTVRHSDPADEPAPAAQFVRISTLPSIRAASFVRNPHHSSLNKPGSLPAIPVIRFTSPRPALQAACASRRCGRRAPRAVPVKTYDATAAAGADIPDEFDSYKQWPNFTHPIRDQARESVSPRERDHSAPSPLREREREPSPPPRRPPAEVQVPDPSKSGRPAIGRRSSSRARRDDPISGAA
jgi:hypothetical protein